MSDSTSIATSSWDQLDVNVVQNLTTSLTSIRIPTLVRIRQLVQQGEVSVENFSKISTLLLQSYNFYQDDESRKQVLLAIEALIAAKPDLLNKYVKYIFDLTIPPKSLAITDLLSLLAWINRFSVLSAADLTADIVIVQASLLEQIIQTTSDHKHHDKHNRRVYQSVLTQTKLSIRNTIIASESLELVVDLYVSTLCKPTVNGNLALLGLLADSVSELLPTHPTCLEVFKSHTHTIVEFYSQHVLLGKLAPNRSSLSIFGHFIHMFVDEPEFTETILPNLERANLRSAELTFGGHLVTELFQNIDPLKFSLLDVVILKSDKILAQFISAFKSMKEETRDGAASAFTDLLKQLSGIASEESISKMISEIFKALKTTSNVEQKCIFANIIKLITTNSSEILTQLLPLVAKDQNEISLTAYVQAFIHQIIIQQSGGADIKKFIDQVISGLKEKKLNLRKVWATEVGEAFYSNPNSELIQQFLPALQLSVDEANKAPLPTIANKGIASSYVGLVISSLNNKSTDNTASIETILTNQKVYSKILGQDCLWYLRALREVPSSELKSTTNAWIHFSLSNTIEVQYRRLAVKFIGEIQREGSNTFADDLIQGLLETIRLNDDTSHSMQYEHVSSLVSEITNENTSVSTLKNLLILSFYPGINIKNGWTGLCQRCKADPGEIVSSNYQDILTTCLSEAKLSSLYTATIKSIGLCLFIQPEIVPTYLIEEYFKNKLDIQKLNAINSTDISIWKASDGELVIDPLTANKKEAVIDKNSKDFETKKWEQEMRKELESKGQQQRKKYTREEQQKIDARLKEELEIRCAIQNIVDSFARGLDIVNELVQESNSGLVDNGAKHWYPFSVDFVLSLITEVDNSKFFGDSAWKTYLKLSQLLTSRLGDSMKLFIGVATLRVYRVPNVTENYLEEPILNLISRLLFRIKFLSDSKPLDSLSLSYILPLLKQVLENGKRVAIQNAASRQAVTSEFVEEDPEEEQLLLAMEIIGSHAEAFEDEFIPRTYILKELISLMKLPTRAKLAKECFLSICQHISVNINNSDLQLLLDTTISPEVFVRTAVLEGLDSEFDLQEFAQAVTFSPQLWIAVHDNDEQCRELATAIWNENDFQLLPSKEFVQVMIPFFHNIDHGLRFSIAKAIRNGVEEGDISDVLSLLIETFWIIAKPPAAVVDQFGLVIKSSQEQKDNWEGRSTIALTFKELNSKLTTESVLTIFNFLVKEKGLADKDTTVRQELQEAGVDIIQKHGSSTISELIPIFDDSLASSAAAAPAPVPVVKKTLTTKLLLNRKPLLNTKTPAKAKAAPATVPIVESVVILYGALARHLDETDSRLEIIVQRLLKTLDTSSEDVQFSVSECISPLVVKFNKEQLSKYFDSLLDNLFLEGANLRLRRGAAYGIAGLVKGSGIQALSKYDVLRTLTDASDDKKNAQRREGVSLAIYCLSKLLGKFFEPYVIEVLPIILKSLGDQVPEVRESTDLAARQIMKSTTSFGVKQLIPLAIANLDEIQWRSKKGSVELLGSMAYLDPTQLSASLSTIVPEIVGVLNDTHKEVRKAADQSLKRFGEVIRNPEIQQVVSDLLNAIGDPTKYTDEALDKLIKTQFVHYIDGPSLALIIHVIHRGMRDRSAATKRKACQIVGNMAFLVDGGDLKPYLSQLVGELEIAMVDPVPGTRSTAARALGSLVEKLGEDQFPDLIPRLLDALQDEARAGDRLGSAQALSEVVCGLGINKLEELLPEILRNATSSRNYIRAGFMPLLLFLPVCFGSQFSPYLSKIIPPILNGLADIDEEIRDTALRAGRLIVKNYAKKAVDLLLPELELGLSDENYRIRLSSVELTGDLLFQVTGISSKILDDNNGEESDDDEEDVGVQSSEINRALTESLGQERRDRILALLFICRSDVAGIVRSAAVDIWKALVANTPRTVKEILPTLTRFIVLRLASSDETQRTIAAQTLGDMVRRVGANALAQLLPTLEESLTNSSDNDAKQGICIALNELIRSSQHDALVEYQDVFIRTIRDALTDPAPGVREAAAQAFESLQEELGKVVIDEILPHLLNLLSTGSGEDEGGVSENALLALRDIMATKSDVIFPILLPSLLAPPIDAFKATALASLASVAGPALYKRLGHVMNVMVQAILDSKANNESEEQQQEIKDAFDSVLLAIDSDEGLHPLMQQLLSLVKHEDAGKRAVIYARLGNFFTNTHLDYSVYTQDMIGQFVLSLGDKATPEVVLGTYDALSAIVKQQSKESLEKLVKPTRQALALTGVRGEDLAGFVLPRGPSCILPIFLHGLMYGNSEQKELSASGIAEIIDKTPAANLKPFATTITGPLIRVIGEKVNSDIKAAILEALTALLGKIPQFLRPFIPQLQRTFVRSISDPTNDKLRNKAVLALGVLIEFQPRVDSLVTELVSGAKATTEQAVKTSILRGILEVVSKAGKNMSEISKTSIMTLVEEEITKVNEKSSVAYARLVGSLSKILLSSEATNILRSKILENDDESNKKFAILSINSFLKDAPNHIFQTGLLQEIVDFIIESANSTQVYISDNATVAIGKILLLNGEFQSPKTINPVISETAFDLPHEFVTKLVEQLCQNSLQPPSNSPDSRRLALVALRTVARLKYDLTIREYLDILAPSVFTCIRDPIIPIRLAAEKAWLAIFQLVEDEKMVIFNEWFEGKTEFTNILGAKIQPRSIGDYTKRVAARLASVERERIEQGGDQETLFSDRFEDENEVWAVGGVDLNK